MKNRIGNEKYDQRLDDELLLNDETKEITDIKVVEDYRRNKRNRKSSGIKIN